MNKRAAQRGTASVEIVVMLPFFVLLWAGVYHLHTVGSAALLSAERARGCAFQFAVQGCRDADKGAGLCAGVRAAKSDHTEQLNKQSTAAGGSGQSLQRDSLTSSISDKIEKIPVVGALWTGIFGEGSVAVANVTAPRFRERDTDVLQTGHYLVCNTVAKTWADLRKEQLCGLANQLGLSGKIFGC